MVNKPKVWNNEQVTDYSLNQNILMPLSNMDTADNTTFSTTSATYVNARTLAVGANQVANYVIIEFDFDVYISVNASSNVTDTTNARITVDGVQQVELTVSAKAQTVASNYDESRCVRTVKYKFTPTPTQRANGFTINVDLYNTLSVGAGAAGTYNSNNNYWVVWGA